MKSSPRSLLLAAAITAVADAQTTTVINDPIDTSTTTVYYSVCPTATTTTVTLPSTITFCPGEGCNGGGPTITAPPNPEYTSTILHVTFTGTDGKITELAEYITVFDAPCTNGPGLCHATYTITEECPCHTRDTEVLPTGFTTTVHACNACGPDGSSSTLTQTVPCPTGPYASVTPVIGPAATGGAYASAGAAASAGAQAGSNGAGSNAAGAAGADSNAAAGSGHGGASAAAGAGAGAGASAGAGNGSGAAAANAGAGANAAAGAGAAPGGSADQQVGAGVGSGNGTSPPITGYTGAADRTVFAFSTLLVAVIGSFAWML